MTRRFKSKPHVQYAPLAFRVFGEVPPALFATHAAVAYRAPSGPGKRLVGQIMLATRLMPGALILEALQQIGWAKRMNFEQLINWSRSSRFLRFAAVGATGVLVNEATLLLAHGVCGAGAYASWFIAFAVGVTYSWWGNRNLTFADRASEGHISMLAEWARFVATNSFGAAVNFAIYSLLLSFAAHPLNIPYVALVIGILAGLVFNFILSNKLVFRDKGEGLE